MRQFSRSNLIEISNHFGSMGTDNQRQSSINEKETIVDKKPIEQLIVHGSDYLWSLRWRWWALKDRDRVGFKTYDKDTHP